MAGKRRADKELTDRNWDDEDEKEDPGEFQKASDDIIKARVIKRAKHRINENLGDGPDNDAPKSAFAGFGGFAFTKTTNQTPSFFKKPDETKNPAESTNQTPSFFSRRDETKDPAKPTSGAFAGIPQFSFKSASTESTKSDNSTGSLGFKFPSLAKITEENDNPVNKEKNSPKSSTISKMTSVFGAANSNQSSSANCENTALNNNPEYLRHINALNRSFVKWITEHIEKNPCCILTPTFPDYTRHLESISRDYPDTPAEPKNVISIPSELQQTKETLSSPTTNEKPAAPLSMFKFKADDSSTIKPTAPFTSFNQFKAEDASTIKPTAPFTSFNQFKAEDASTIKPTAPFTSFGQFKADDSSTIKATAPFTGFTQIKADDSATIKPAAPFTSFNQFKAEDASTIKPAPFGGFGSPFGATTGFSFASSVPVSGPQSQEEEEYVPPKAEVIEAKEEGSLYTIRCKLFYQKEGKWMDRGVGNVHLKDSGGKCQLIIRADTNLATILLNIAIPESMPVKRQGKNNVSLLCVPNPQIDAKIDPSMPVPLLLRVKTGDLADELIAKIDDVRKSD